MNYLSSDFLASKGIVITKKLKDWLTRASFVARTRGGPGETERYAKWALCVLEDQLKTQTVEQVEWKTVPTVMSAKALAREPRMLSGSDDSAKAVQETHVGHRADLYKECTGRAPPELRHFLDQAFDLYDRDVAKGKRHYEQVSFMEMLNIARNLQKKELTDKTQAQLRGQQTALLSSGPGVAAPTVTRAAETSSATCGDKRQRAEPSAALSSGKVSSAGEQTDNGVHSKRTKVETLLVTASECASFFLELITTDDAKTERVCRTFVAKSRDLERRYSRYEPTEEDIRPLQVLEKSFDYIVEKSREKEKQDTRSNALKYLSDQLKGMRQDLRVQNIVNDFTVMIYELHARICLEANDIGEFNQCQASLKGFYEHRSVDKSRCHMAEFFVYRVVYLSLSKQYDSLSTELIEYTNTLSLGQSAAMKEFLPTPERMQHVLQLIVALDNGDALSAVQLLQLFKRELQFLVQIYLPRMRVYWLYSILCGVRGNMSLRFIMSNLGFLPTAASRGGDTGVKAEQFWMDGNKEAAHKTFHELFSTLKVPLPTAFSFDTEVEVGHSTGVSIDASAALRQVEEYIQYLGTRKDAQI
ncbi:hypothetical protein STCU_06699 [Strigomonas culicis]|uniref:SAC3/GANP/THP3 conserved domain-containing protein n=1 Tax=Strigomonas culicis TaxID=28005 RepID=S9U1U3_9TRYP|nr:hypothetical protein STCU_08061 [Strigomonas culicis]EPY25544.1 hypothetical protein STCU_06699 [Strigomonas culicis]|eukprot:EPY22898.1 hypothetical protein STCU_08061 [Strigomonas culicis]